MRDKLGQRTRVLRQDQFIQIAGQHQRRAANGGKRPCAVELGKRLKLQVGRMQRRRQRNFAPHLRLGSLRMPSEITRGIGYFPNPPGGLFR